MYQHTLCSFWKNLSGHFSRSPLNCSLNRSYGYASAGDSKNWLTEISPEFCTGLSSSAITNFNQHKYLMVRFTGFDDPVTVDAAPGGNII